MGAHLLRYYLRHFRQTVSAFLSFSLPVIRLASPLSPPPTNPLNLVYNLISFVVAVWLIAQIQLVNKSRSPPLSLSDLLLPPLSFT